MKSSLLLSLLLAVLFSFSSHEAIPIAIIELDEMNIVYKHLENPISISVPTVPRNQVFVQCEGGYLFSKGAGQYILKPSSGSTKIGIKVSIKQEGIMRLVGSKFYRVRQLPTPIPQLGGLPNNGLPQAKAAVLAQSTLLSTYGPGFPYNMQSRVSAFEASICKEDTMIHFAGEGSKLTKEIRSHIASLESGDILLFHHIKGYETKTIDTINYNLPPIVIPIR